MPDVNGVDSCRSSGSFPLFSAISVLTTLCGEVLIILVGASLHDVGWGGIIVFSIGPILALIAMPVALLLNGLLGHLAARRREPWGGDVARIGMLVWALTVVVLALLPSR